MLAEPAHALRAQRLGFLDGLATDKGASPQHCGSLMVRMIFQPSAPKRSTSMLRMRCRSAEKPSRYLTAVQRDTMTASSSPTSIDSVWNVQLGRGPLRLK